MGYRIGNFGFSGGSALLAIAGGNTVSVGSTLAKVSVGLLGLNILFAQTRKSNGYYGERWPGDPHKPDHVHLRGNGIDIRIGRDGNPLPGEDPLSSQARKALHKLWTEFEKLFAKW